MDKGGELLNEYRGGDVNSDYDRPIYGSAELMVWDSAMEGRKKQEAEVLSLTI